MTEIQQLEKLEATIKDSQEQAMAIREGIKKREEGPWEPPQGRFAVTGTGDVIEPLNLPKYGSFGAVFSIPSEALEASKRMRFYNRLCKLAQDVNPSGKAGGKFHVPFKEDTWAISGWICWGTIDSVFETKKSAKRAAEIMNRDGWKLPF